MPKKADSDPAKWVLPPHTQAKHQILARYLDGWFPVLASGNGRIIFLDGFAGRGRYTDGSVGSPIIALTHLLDRKDFARFAHREFVFLFVEADPDNATSLEYELGVLQATRQPWPANVKIRLFKDEFENVADELITTLQSNNLRLAPMFAFIDPFGFEGLPMAKLAALAAQGRAIELCVNFAVNNVNRFLLEEKVRPHIEALFGCGLADVVRDWDGVSLRPPHLREVYGRQLSATSGLPYVQSFEMRNDSGNVAYYLFHATAHERGVELMKDAMWKLDPVGTFSFSDRLAGLEVLFTPEPDLTPLQVHLCAKWRGQGEVAIEAVRQYVMLHTPYRGPHLTKVLRQLEKDGSIVVRRPHRTGYPDGTFVRF